ncbi:MAG: hypothetical protein IKZ92_05375 [Muribaculaceae bacterium]|nr:hypothetical protein [Muribaculaceae bacterium]
MKKFLLLAVMTAVAFGASADGYKFEKVWELNTAQFNFVTNDVRAGFGMNGKFYINDKGTQTVYVIDENGLTGTTYAGGLNCGITRDEAGNILVSNAAFPGVWGADASIIVINPKTGESVEYIVPEECGLLGRCDFIGFAKGDFFDEGSLYLTGGNTGTDPYTNGVAVFSVAGGEVDFDNCYTATVEPAVTGQTSTVINYYKDLNGDDALLYAYRSGAPSKLMADGDNFTKTAISLPNKGACNGCFPFVWDGKELFIYPTLPNYLNGFAIAEAGAEAPMFEVAATVAANMNSFQNNWVNAEVDENGVTIYQYAPGANLAVWRLTKEAAEPKNVYILGEVNEQQWAANAGTLMDYDAENNVYTATVTLDGRGESGENYFSFTTELAENNDDGGWAYIAPFRFGAVSEGDYWYDDMYDGQPLGLTYENGQAFRVMGGEYKLTVSLENMTITIERIQPEVMRGDVDKSGNVSIADVTTLIDMLLNGAEMIPEADCDLNGSMSIADVTTLIDFLLNGTWPE